MQSVKQDLFFFSKQMSWSRSFATAAEAGRSGAMPRHSRPCRDAGLSTLIALENDNNSPAEALSVREHVLLDMQNETAALSASATSVTLSTATSSTSSSSSLSLSPISAIPSSSTATASLSSWLQASTSTTVASSLWSSSSSTPPLVALHSASPPAKRKRLATAPYRLLFKEQQSTDLSTQQFRCLFKPEAWDKGGNIHNVLVTCPLATVSNLKRHAETWHLKL
jgi:hypothetical protein